MNVPRVVVTTRPTALQRVIERHGTAGQARFFLASRGLSLDDLQRWQAEQDAAVAAVEAAIPMEWRRAYVQRRDIDRFLFEPDDIVAAVGRTAWSPTWRSTSRVSRSSGSTPARRRSTACWCRTPQPTRASSFAR